MAKRTIFLPVELQKEIRQIKKLGYKFNISKICQEALRKELSTKTT